MARRRPTPAPAAGAVDHLGETRPHPNLTYPLTLTPDGVVADSRAARVMGLVSLVVGVGIYVVVTPLVNVGVQSLVWTVSGAPGSMADYVAAGQRFEHVWGLVGQHLGLGVLTLVLLAIMRFLHRRDPRWLWSVSPGVRWRYLMACLLVAVPVFGAGLLSGGLSAWHPQQGALGWIVAIALTSPLQAIAEEVLFRGYLLQAMGMAVRHEAFAVVASAVLFAVFHGTQNTWLFASRLGFGLLAGFLVWRTGGLEAPIAAHIVNNLLAFGAAVLTSSVAEVRAVQQIGWAETVRDLLGYVAFGAGALWVAVRMRVPVRTPALPATPAGRRRPV